MKKGNFLGWSLRKVKSNRPKVLEDFSKIIESTTSKAYDQGLIKRVHVHILFILSRISPSWPKPVEVESEFLSDKMLRSDDPNIYGSLFFNCWPRHWANILFFEWKLVVHRWTTLSTRPPQIVRHILYPSAWSGQSDGQDKTDVYKLQPNGTPQQCNLQKHTTGPNAYHFSTNG